MASKNESDEAQAETFITPEEAARNSESGSAPEVNEVGDVEGSTESGAESKSSEVTPKPTDQKASATSNKFKRLERAYWSKKKWTLPVTVLAILIILFAIPLTRYWTLGIFVKGQVSISAVDSKTGQPVSSALVTINGKQLKSDSTGKATGKVSLGRGTLSVTKQYYTSSSQTVTVILSKSANTFKVSLVATGRQVPISVVNKITGKPLANAVLTAANTEVKTDKNGKATIVLPTKSATQAAKLNLTGYNQLAATVTVTDKVVASNKFSLTPAGKVYFLSNQSGKIDVVKTNLDGTGRQTVLAGTGIEDPNQTSLLAARDWKYVALLSKRDTSGNPQLNLIDTSTDKVTNIDQGDASFAPVGWDNDYFIYTVARNGYNSWQPNAVSLKSFNAETGKLTTLDSTKATGSSNYDAKYEALFDNAVHIVGDTIIYSKLWYAYPGYLSVSGQQNTLNAIQADGSGKKSVASLDAATAYFGTLYQYSPNELVVAVSYENNDPQAYYEYKSDGSYAKDTEQDDIDAAKNYLIDNAYVTYLQSPSGSQTFWSKQQDGKNALFVGDKDGQNGKQIGSLSDYTAFGWYSDDYLLVAKNSSELYILPADGSASPQKISDYYKPPINYYGYGGGYGGL